MRKGRTEIWGDTLDWGGRGVETCYYTEPLRGCWVQLEDRRTSRSLVDETHSLDQVQAGAVHVRRETTWLSVGVFSVIHKPSPTTEPLSLPPRLQRNLGPDPQASRPQGAPKQSLCEHTHTHTHLNQRRWGATLLKTRCRFGRGPCLPSGSSLHSSAQQLCPNGRTGENL